MAGAPLPRATALLLELHELAAKPSHRELSAYTTEVSASAIWNVLRGQGEPRPKTINSFISACLEYARHHRRSARLSKEQWSLDYWLERYNELNTPSRPEPSGEVNLLTGKPVRTRYHEQVRRIAPVRLVGREPELAELAAFCAAPGDSYAYWRAEPWSGKSALMSWFALHPPAGVRIVSFFITARLSSQNDRAAFIDNVVEQLITLLGQDVPPFLTEATREPYLLGLFANAAEACQDRGERFVLLVDGLDEDRGVTINPDAHSIAALLPAGAAASGMRVIVSGRPNPPIPWDVPEHHPLHDPGIVRTLSPSPAAQAVRADMERELKHLLRGTPAEQHLLGVLTAAGGGLTAADLAVLTGLSEWTVRDHLRTVTGRTFTHRASDYRPGIEPDIYLLGHEELQATARDVLGPTRLASYRQRVHTWVEGYRDRGWPDDTPEYLLRGYYDLLAETGDLPRMIACATDLARQDRLLEASGGDATALAQIAIAQDRVLAQDPPDLTAMVRLAIHRDHLHDRNSHIPTDLPAVWVTLGQPNRAEALVRSSTDSTRRMWALLALAAALAAAGDQERAIGVLTEAAAVAHTSAVAPHIWLTRLVDTMVEIGEIDRAEGLARTIADPHAQCAAVRPVVAALVRVGEPGHAAEVVAHAEAVARTTITATERTIDPQRRRSALTSVAEALLEVGDRHRATELLAEAEALATPNDMDAVREMWIKLGELDHAEDLARGVHNDAITDRDDRGAALASIARAMAEAHEFDRAEALARLIDHPDRRNDALESVVTALIKAGDTSRAEKMANSLPDPFNRNRSLVAVATAMATSGMGARATKLIDHVVADVRSMADAYQRGLLLTKAATALFAAGASNRAIDAFDEAEACADAESGPRLLTSIAKALADAGESNRATVLIRRAEGMARTLRYRYQQMEMVTSLARALAQTGEFDRAESLGRTLGPYDQEPALTPVVLAMAKAGEIDRAEAVARSVRGPAARSEPLVSVATVMAEAGEFDRAETLAGTLADAGDRTVVLTSVVAALFAAGRRGRATKLAAHLGANMGSFAPLNTGATLLRTLVEAGEFDCAEAVARHITHPLAPWDTLVSVVRMMAETAAFDRAEALARTITDPRKQSGALASVAQAMADTGERNRAAELVTDAETLARAHPQRHAFIAIAQALVELGERDRAIDLISEAEALARSATDTIWPGRKLLPVARALAETGEFDRAEAVARGITDTHQRDDALKSVARVMANAGEFDRAEAIARGITRPSEQDDALKALVEAMVEAGEFERAEALARTIANPYTQANALRALAASDAPRRAAATASILMLRRWYAALDAAVRLEPGVLDTILAELASVDQGNATWR